MKPLLLLIVVFAATSAISKFVTSNWSLPLSANLAMCPMLCFTALGHFMFPKGMAMMIPPFIPYKTALVYITGIAEVLLGLALLFPALRPYTGYVLIVFFILILPANIYAAIKHIDLEKGTYGGPGPNYLWFRIPMQLFLIAWVYYFSISSSI
ncbi:hypothetical protein [Chitinophaga sp. MM2321]|uniref:DoxX family protein n=1 Tax=Chitinophaga sp. MM2321 TaxID=3137178 RepID=UPI0032D589DF